MRKKERKMVKRTKIYCNSPIGKIEAPQEMANIIINETNEQLLTNIEINGFIDPFRYEEARRRNLLLLNGNIPNKEKIK